MKKFENLRSMLEKSFKLHSSLSDYEQTTIPHTNLAQITAFRVEKDIKLNKKSISNTAFIYNGEQLINTNQFSIQDASIIINKSHNNGVRRVFIKQIEKDMYLEIFDNSMLIKTIKLDAIGKVCNSPVIVKSSIQWSKDGSRLMFLANRKEKKYDLFNEKPEEAFETLESFNYKHNFGEGITAYNTDMELNMVEISEKNGSLDAELFKVSFDSQGLSISKFDFQDAQGKSITFSAYELQKNEYLMGPSACSNKKSGVYILQDCLQVPYSKPDKDEKKDEVEKDEKSLQKPFKINDCPIAFTAIVSLDGKQIAYFYNDELLNIHCYELGLRVYNVETSATETVISTKEKENIDELVIWNFPHQLNNATWIDDTNIVFNNSSDAVNSVCMVDTKEKKLYNLDYNKKFLAEQVTFLTQIREDEWLVDLNSIGYASRLGILKNAKEAIKTSYKRDVKKEDKFGLIKENIDEKRKSYPEIFLNADNCNNGEYYVDGIRGFLWGLKDTLLPEGMTADERPQAVYLHGGPNSITTGTFSPVLNVLMSKGFQVLTVNYSGSISFDTAFVRALSTKNGRLDILEAQNFIDRLAECQILSKKNMYYIGGSYSGQLGQDFAQTFPGYFKKYVLRNPVVNYLHQAYNTDLCDWNIAQIEPSTHEPYDIAKDYTQEQIEKMVKVSPGLKPFDVEKLKDSKFLIQIGTGDKRVPHDAAIHTYKKLKKLGINVKLQVYPDEPHSLSKEVKHMFDAGLTTLVEFVE